MPVERVSKTFKDISMSFRANPVSSDLIGLKDENAISRSIRNLVLTAPGERFFNQNLGSRVSQSLFENLDEITASIIKDEIIAPPAEAEVKVKEEIVVSKNIMDEEPKEISTSKDSEIEIMVREEENKKVDAQVEVDAEAPEP